ncbi:MAG TPA: phospholipase D-like domain-containing protein [Gemmatimonadaceae bacterium]|nr:phospholipase D-like domain-containing protein [Gemmatimonadaceae bacterium]
MEWLRRDTAGLIQIVTAVVLTLAAVIGLLFLTRGTAVHTVRGVGGDGSPVAPSDPDFALTFAVLTGTSLLGGNEVTLALDGDGTWPALWADLRSAKRTIMIEMYYAAPGRVADTLGTILAERARAGVEVYFLYDAFGSGFSRRYIDGLRAAGVKAVSFRPLRFRNLWVVQNRLHVRAVVIDGRIGWTGGFGIDDKWLGGGHRANQWRETNARFAGPATLQLESAFIAGWSEATGELLSGRATAAGDAPGRTSAALLYTAPTLGSTAAERFLALSIASAREKLYITNAYFAPDSNFVSFLTDAAKRGVDVRILVGGPLTDVRAARLAARARYETLLAAGARVYEYQPSTLHAKTFVVDGRWVSIGTMNFDNRSLSLNDESTLVVLDSSTGGAMERVFFDDLRYSKEIDLAEFRRRPWTERIAEWAANQITRLL